MSRTKYVVALVLALVMAFGAVGVASAAVRSGGREPGRRLREYPHTRRDDRGALRPFLNISLRVRNQFCGGAEHTRHGRTRGRQTVARAVRAASRYCWNRLRAEGSSQLLSRSLVGLSHDRLDEGDED